MAGMHGHYGLFIGPSECPTMNKGGVIESRSYLDQVFGRKIVLGKNICLVIFVIRPLSNYAVVVTVVIRRCGMHTRSHIYHVVTSEEGPGVLALLLLNGFVDFIARTKVVRTMIVSTDKALLDPSHPMGVQTARMDYFWVVCAASPGVATSSISLHVSTRITTEAFAGDIHAFLDVILVVVRSYGKVS